MDEPPTAEKERQAVWKVNNDAQTFYEKFYHLVKNEIQQPDIAHIWAVKQPTFMLRDLLGSTNFGRRRWFITNNHATTFDTRTLLRPTAPGFIERQWESWKHPQPWLNLLNLWTPVWLQTQVGSPLASLQLLVDVADHLRTRELLPLDEKSRTMTALLTSAESLLKWPAHYLTLMRRENEHPLNELRPQEEIEWAKMRLRMDYLTQFATNYSQTQNLAAAIHKELVLQLTMLEINPPLTPSTLKNEKLPKVANPAVVSLMPPPQTAHTAGKPIETRKRTATEALLKDMGIRCKIDRNEGVFEVPSSKIKN